MSNILWNRPIVLSMIQSWTQYRHTLATFQLRSFEANSFPLAALWPCLPVLWRFPPLFLQRVEYIVTVNCGMAISPFLIRLRLVLSDSRIRNNQLTALLAARRNDPLLGSGYWRKVYRMAFFPRLTPKCGRTRS